MAHIAWCAVQILVTIELAQQQHLIPPADFLRHHGGIAYRCLLVEGRTSALAPGLIF